MIKIIIMLEVIILIVIKLAMPLTNNTGYVARFPTREEIVVEAHHNDTIILDLQRKATEKNRF